MQKDEAEWESTMDQQVKYICCEIKSDSFQIIHEINDVCSQIKFNFILRYTASVNTRYVIILQNNQICLFVCTVVYYQPSCPRTGLPCCQLSSVHPK